jgi:hypothetical protein
MDARISDVLRAGFCRMLPDYGNRLCRRNVVARSPVFFPTDAVEVLLNKLLPSGQSVAAVHRETLWQKESVLNTPVVAD